MINALVTNTHALTRIGICTLLERTHDMNLAGETADGYKAMHLCSELKPDIMLWDLNMPGPQAIEMLHFLQEQSIETKIMVLTHYNEKACVRDLISAGIAGYVLDDETEEAVINAIRTVMQGGIWFSRAVVGGLVDRKDDILSQKKEPPLTNREQQFLERIAQGWDNNQIAEHFSLSKQTVRNYIGSLYIKLGVHSRAEAIVWARDHGVGGIWCADAKVLYKC